MLNLKQKPSTHFRMAISWIRKYRVFCVSWTVAAKFKFVMMLHLLSTPVPPLTKKLTSWTLLFFNGFVKWKYDRNKKEAWTFDKGVIQQVWVKHVVKQCKALNTEICHKANFIFTGTTNDDKVGTVTILGFQGGLYFIYSLPSVSVGTQYNVFCRTA